MKADHLCNLISEAFQTNAVTEYRFAAMLSGGVGKGSRERIKAIGLSDWRFDVFIPEYGIAIEFEGGLFTNGAHSRGLGVLRDIAKYNSATVNGYKVLRYTHTHHKYSDILADLARIIQPVG
jgi:hypothetical protein